MNMDLKGLEESLQAAVADADDGDADFQLTKEQAKMLLEQAGGNEGLAAALQGKLAEVIGSSSGFVESLPKHVRRRIAALQDLQEEHSELEEEYRKERAALEAKYRELYAPYYEKRRGIVTGEVEPPPKEKEEGEEEEEEEEEEAAADGEDEDVKGIPNFWLYVLRNHEVTEEQITDKDEEALKHLIDIKWEHFDGEDTKGFKLFFYFEPNPFFDNDVLTKTYTMIDEDDPILEHAEGTDIKWKQGKNLTVKIMKKKPKKGKAAGKTLTKTEPCESFFNFFSPPKIPEDGEELEEEEMEQLQEVMEADYEIGSVIKEKLIPHAVHWFTGEALQELEDDDDDEDDDDEDGEDDDDEEGAAMPSGLQDTAEKPPECKQQ